MIKQLAFFLMLMAAPVLHAQDTLRVTPPLIEPPARAGIKITITDEQTGKPVRGAVVELIISSGNEVLHALVTDSLGIAVLTNIKPAAYTLRASAKNYYYKQTPNVVVMRNKTTYAALKLAPLKKVKSKKRRKGN